MKIVDVIIVGVVLFAVALVVIRGIINRRNGKTNSCSGCPFAQDCTDTAKTCAKKDKKEENGG